ncbi:hypothetical protein [Streptomyces lycii]|uniref:DUF3180 domain-containing protein n=1 Tax=Streptomyces lycii TaxID=2654337 RepID=A0ABQ7FIW8_9ACTN|nr:hypothetical protein [Streptomyces lycii]KAF4408610.1 hypothetical protein GCU69_12995 [Streptomyces lycii]
MTRVSYALLVIAAAVAGLLARWVHDSGANGLAVGAVFVGVFAILFGYGVKLADRISKGD